MPKFEWPDRMMDERRNLIATVIWTIYENAPIEDEDGRVTSIILSLLQEERIEISTGYLNKILTDLASGELVGKFINRDIRGKRTYAITCTRKPGRNAFPDDPRRGRRGAVAVVEVDEIEAVIEYDAEILDLPPGVSLETLPQPSKVDRYLYIVSLLNEMITEEVTAPERRFEEQIEERLTAVNRVLEENERLRTENDGLREDKRKLAAALEQSNAMMRDRAARSVNGTREPAASSA